MKTFDTNNDYSENYKLLIGAIVPRPIAVVSTLNEDGTSNLAPFSFFTAVSANPMIIAFCPIRKPADGSKKDTLLNIERNKEFVVNFVTEEIASQINECATELPFGESEFTYAGLTPIDSEKVQAKRLKESPVHYECILRDIISYGDDPGCGTLITGEVLKVHVDENIIHDSKIDTDKLNIVGRGAGIDWVRTKDRFQLQRKTKSQIHK